MTLEGMTLAELAYPLRILLNCYTMFLGSLFFFLFLTPRARLRPPLVFGLTYAAMLLVLPCALLIYSHFALKLLLVSVGLFLILTLLYQDSAARRAIAVLSFYILIILSEGLTSALIALVHGASLPMIASESSRLADTMPATFLLYTLCLGVPCLLLRRRAHSAFPIPLSRFLILPLSQVILMSGFLYAFLVSERRFGSWDAFVLAVMAVVCVAVDLLFLRIIGDLVEKKQLEEQQLLQKQHYAALMEQQSYIRQLRHDIANHLMTVNLLAQEDAGRAERYIEELTESFRQKTAIDFCENRVADAVLFGKSVEAAALGLRCSVDAALPELSWVRETDLMSLLSNLLDNALEAAGKSEEKWVRVTLRREAGTVFLAVENSLPEGAVLETGRSRKGELHGQGLRIVEDLCRRYHGSFRLTQEGSTARAAALLVEGAP